MENSIDINNKLWYKFNEPKERTEMRLKEMISLGMVETGNASFGVIGVMSGLYIEWVWSYDDERWKSYMDWVKSRIAEKNNTIETKTDEKSFLEDSLKFIDQQIKR